MIATLALLAGCLSADPTAWTLVTNQSIKTISGTPTFVQNFNLTLGSETARGADWIQLRRAERPRPDWPSEFFVLLANGDCVAGTIVKGDTQSITLKSEVLATVRIPLTAVAMITTVRLAGTPDDPLMSEWLGDRKTDALRIQNGDTLRGSVTKISANGDSVDFRENGQPVKTIAANKIAAVGFAAGLSRVKTPAALHAHVVLSDGSRLTVSGLKTLEDSVDFTAAAGFSGRIKLNDLNCITLRGGAAVPLPDLKPVRIETKPFLSVTWPTQIHRSAKKNRLRIDRPFGQDRFDSGMGIHATTNLEYDLAGKYKRFDAVVGMDAVTGRGGRVKFTLAIDDSSQSQVLSSETGATEISKPLTQAKRLKLIVDAHDFGDREADVNFGDVWLVK